MLTDGRTQADGVVDEVGELETRSEENAAIVSFYDQLAPWYHLLYPDWEASIVRQGAALAALLESCGISAGSKVFDVSCGIGTQTIGLAQLGYIVEASDLSPLMVMRTQSELSKRGLNASVLVGDMRDLSRIHLTSADAIVACDNAVTHCADDAEILATFRELYKGLRQGGVAVLSLRDFSAMERRNPDVHVFHPHQIGQRRYLAQQLWEWDGDRYDLRLYLTEEWPAGQCETRVLSCRVYAVSVRRVLALLASAGFSTVERRDGVLFQPVLLAIK